MHNKRRLNLDTFKSWSRSLFQAYFDNLNTSKSRSLSLFNAYLVKSCKSHIDDRKTVQQFQNIRIIFKENNDKIILEFV